MDCLWPYHGQPGLQRIEGERMEQELKRKTMVIGHRNPDTDSICSAICYANLKRALTGDEYVPARAGHVNVPADAPQYACL